MLICLGFGLVAAVIGVGQFIVLGLADAAERDAQAPDHAKVLARQIPAHVIVEQLEVPVFVGRDQLADLLQDGFRRGLRQGGVIAGGAGLHHAAGDQFAGAGATDGGVGVGLDPVAGAVAVECSGEVPVGIGQFGPFRQGVAVLDLFLGPVVGRGAEIRVVAEDAAEIQRVVAAIALHHCGGLDQWHQGRVHAPRDRNRPRQHLRSANASSRCRCSLKRRRRTRGLSVTRNICEIRSSEWNSPAATRFVGEPLRRRRRCYSWRSTTSHSGRTLTV